MSIQVQAIKIKNTRYAHDVAFLMIEQLYKGLESLVKAGELNQQTLLSFNLSKQINGNISVR